MQRAHKIRICPTRKQETRLYKTAGARIVEARRLCLEKHCRDSFPITNSHNIRMSPFYQSENFLLYHGDCLEVLSSMQDGVADMVITSPPYNCCRKGISLQCKDKKESYNRRYDAFIDAMPSLDYEDWTSKLFVLFDRVLKKDAVVLYNFGMGADSETDYSMRQWFKCVLQIEDTTPWKVVDMLFWHKKKALPNNVSPNKSTRIVEPVLVFCRKGEEATFISNKKVSSLRGTTSQKMYAPFYNFFRAANNDEFNELNKATYSSEFCSRLIDLYAPEEYREKMTVLDPFSGTGTTGVACVKYNMGYIGIELSEPQCRHTVERLSRGVQQMLI